MTEYATAEEIGALFDWSPGYVIKLAHQERWTRTRTRPARYDLQDVMNYAALHKRNTLG